MSSSSSYQLEDILALNDEIICLSRSELPLDPHLAGMSRELSGRQRELAARFAERVSAGQPLEQIFAEFSDGFPAMYQAVLVAGIRSGNLTAALEEIAATARRIDQLRSSYLIASVYPAILLIMAGVLSSTVGRDQLVAMRGLAESARVPSNSFSLLAIDFLTAIWPVFAALWIVGVLWLLLVLTMHLWPSSILLGNGFFTRLLPGARRVAHYSQWAMVFDIMSLLIRYHCPISDAIRLATSCTGNAKLKRQGAQWADHLEKGDLSPPPWQLNPLSRWLIGSRLPPEALADSLALAGRRYHGQAVRQSQWIQHKLPLYASLAVGGFCVSFYAALLFIPWLALLQQALV